MSAVANIRNSLLAWYDRTGRALPWRAGVGERPDPYRVWLSEIMLQQTTAAHATPYFDAFTRRWPSVQDLAGAPDGAVMAAWAGLGYYARARNLLACADMVANERGGRFPETEGGLRALPGVGAYTAAAVAAIAFARPTNVVDANVERIMARLFAVAAPLPRARAELRSLAAGFVTPERPGDWAQALMDLGAQVCRPARPDCGRCPLAHDCAARRSGDPAAYPRRSARPERPQRHGVAFLAFCEGEVAVVSRPPSGLLGGMLGLPTTDWRTAKFTDEESRSLAPVSGPWRKAGVVSHAFTHFHLELAVFRADLAQMADSHLRLSLATACKSLPTVFRKALDLATHRSRG